MIEEPNNKPRSKMSALLSGGEPKEPVKKIDSPLTRLPKRAKENLGFMPEDADTKAPSLSETIQTPAQPLSKKPTDQTQEEAAPATKKIRLNFGPPFWTITGIMSLLVNGILIGVLLALLVNAQPLQVGGVMNMANGLLGGLYMNFELMDRAHITATIPVESTIPVKFDLQLNQQTNVVLSQDVRIDNARVTVNTGGLNITNALTTITLPAGTSLPIILNLTVPVDTTVPVVLNVPVDIPLANTDLHKPFVGLQNVLQPFYCMIDKNAVNMDDLPICK